LAIRGALLRLLRLSAVPLSRTVLRLDEVVVRPPIESETLRSLG
jgi:hypothetical protein